MNHAGHQHDSPVRGARTVRIAVAALALAMTLARPASTAERAPFVAREGVELATAAARVWAEDAILVYVENDEDLAAGAASERWGYLFRSASREKSRAYSIQGGRILVAEDLEIKFEAPPLAPGWIDSDAALEAAEQGPGGAFRREHEGRPVTMLLMRGAFNDGAPDQTTWTIVYASPHGPSLFVVVDAAGGQVRKTWKG